MTAYESIAQGLTEALAFARGGEAGSVVRRVEVASVDASSAIRASTSPSQEESAASVVSG